MTDAADQTTHDMAATAVTVNDHEMSVADVAPHTTTLQWLRGSGITGPKEGCAEGECGACAVMVSRSDGNGGTRWTSINSCLVPAAALAGQEIYTAEGLASSEALHPVQQEMAVREDRPLVCMPLYHSAGMHIFTVPYLMLGTTIRLLRKPDIELILRRIEEDQITSLFLAPTVWVPLSQHPDLSRRDLGALRKAQYGASIMPTPVLAKLRRALPNAGFYNCFGQSEIGPLASVLRPEEHDARPASCGRSVLFVTTRVVDDSGNDVQPGEPGVVCATPCIEFVKLGARRSGSPFGPTPGPIGLADDRICALRSVRACPVHVKCPALV